MDLLALYYAMYDLRVAAEVGSDLPPGALDPDVVELLIARGLAEYRGRRTALTDRGYNAVDAMYAAAGEYVRALPVVS